MLSHGYAKDNIAIQLIVFDCASAICCGFTATTALIIAAPQVVEIFRLGADLTRTSAAFLGRTSISRRPRGGGSLCAAT